LRNPGIVLSQYQKVLHHQDQKSVLRSQRERHLLREYRVRTKDGVLPRRVLRAGTTLCERTLLVVESGLIIAPSRHGICCPQRPRLNGADKSSFIV